MREILNQKFNQIYFKDENQSSFSPAKVTLMGDYVDFNGGQTLSCALSLGTYGSISKREDREVHVYSNNYSKKVYIFELDAFYKDEEAPWSDYVKGVIAGFYKFNVALPNGFDLYIEGHMPIGFGLSSSASVEMLIASMINDIFDLEIDKTVLAKIGAYAESTYLQRQQSIVEPLTVIHGAKHQVISLNTKSLNFEYLTFDLENHQLIITYLNETKTNKDEIYMKRFEECQKALHVLKPLYQINHLCDLTSKELVNIEKLLSKEEFSRVKYVVSEQERTLAAIKAINLNDIELLSQILNESYDSLTYDFEILDKDLHYLRKLMINEGALGAKVSGSTFGSNLIAVVKKEDAKRITLNVEIAFEIEKGYKPNFFTAKAEEGTHRL